MIEEIASRHVRQGTHPPKVLHIHGPTYKYLLAIVRPEQGTLSPRNYFCKISILSPTGKYKKALFSPAERFAYLATQLCCAIWLLQLVAIPHRNVQEMSIFSASRVISRWWNLPSRMREKAAHESWIKRVHALRAKFYQLRNNYGERDERNLNWHYRNTGIVRTAHNSRFVF